MSTSQAQPPKKKGNSGFKSEADYLRWLDVQRQSRGDTWYKKKLAEMEARKAARILKWKEEREAANQLWLDRIDVWSKTGGFETTLTALSLGHGKTQSGRSRFKIDAVPFEVDHNKMACTRWDGNTFQNGKKGRSGALGLAMCVLELRGSGRPFVDAKELLTGISGISNEQVEVTEAVKKKLELMKQKQIAEEARRREENLREDPLTEEQLSYAPLRLHDENDIKHLTKVMAKERSFPLDYAERCVRDGVVYFAILRGIDKETRKVYTINRPIVTSEVRGFETGNLVAFSSREMKEYYPHQEGKGKNLHFIEKGAVPIGHWNENTKKAYFCEAVYTGLALRLILERLGRPLKEDEVILCMAGSRRPERLLELCKKRGVTVVGAYDNDMAGRKSAADVKEWCKANGVTYQNGLPTRGEIELSFTDCAWARTAYAIAAKEFARQNIKYLFLPPADGELRMVVETTDASCEIVLDLKKHEHQDRELAVKKSNEPIENRLGVMFHRKDWNELIQTQYKPRAAMANGLPEYTENISGIQTYLKSIGLTQSDAAAFLASGLVYPAKSQGKDMAVWVSVNPSGNRVTGYSMVDFETNERIDAGVAWAAGVTIGDPKSDKKFALVVDFKEAIAAWKADRTTTSVVALSKEVPVENLRLAAQYDVVLEQRIPREPDFLALEAGLTAFAAENGLKSQKRDPGIDHDSPGI